GAFSMQNNLNSCILFDSRIACNHTTCILQGVSRDPSTFGVVWRDREVGFCDGLPTLAEHRDGILVAFQDTAITVTADHVFLLANRTLCRADRLAPDDALMGAGGAPVAIDALHTGDYLAGFTRIATVAERPADSLD